jgi:hypothetical protein
MKKKPPGLYANIQAKRARGEKMRKPGEEGAPSASDFKNAAKTAKKKKGAKRQDPGYKMYDKDGCKKCSGDKKDMVGRKSGYADGYGKKCDSIAAEFNAVMDTEAREDKPCGNSFIPEAAKCKKGKGTAKASKESLKKRALAKEQVVNKGRSKKSDPNSPENNGGESVQAKGGYAKFLKKKGINQSKLGANSKKAESLALAYNKTPAGRAEMAKEMMEFEQSRKKRRGFFGRR